MSGNLDNIHSALVTLAVERALLDIGKGLYDKVAGELYKRHKAYFHDCYDHPEYLSQILKELYGNSYTAIVKSINDDLREFSYHRQIERFLGVMRR